MTENHFRMHFSPFQINTQLFFEFFFSKWPPAAILEVSFGRNQRHNITEIFKFRGYNNEVLTLRFSLVLTNTINCNTCLVILRTWSINVAHICY